MSEMFTKCNGFIVSGDPLVYADSATMTGQGTVSEPFGVKSTDLFVQKPLYTGVSGNSAYIGWNNETILWSGDASAFSLSEAATGFDNLQITYYPTEGGTACSTVMYVPSTATSINLFSKYFKSSNDFIIEDVTKFITNDYTNYSYGIGAHAWYSTLST